MTQDKPLKRFGQNYLIDSNITKKLVSQFSPKENDYIFEIGPGEGAITKELCNFCKNITLIEIDKRKIELLNKSFPEAKLINEDFLKIDFDNYKEFKRIRIIGNIPYNITSPIIFKCIENKNIINDVMFMVQHEVAKRIISSVNSKEYGILSVILNYFCEVKLCFKVSRNVFYPKPNVDSAIIHLIFRDNSNYNINEKLFVKIVKSSFGNRRKNLKNSLSNSILKNYNFSVISEFLDKRAEQLTIENFITITKSLQDQYE